MEFACKLAGAKVVLVMGHTACGAIKGAIDNAQLGNLTGLLAKIRPAVEATQYQGERSAKNYAFVDAVARKNVELTMIDIHRRSPVLADLETSGAIKIAGAMYDLETGRSSSSVEVAGYTQLAKAGAGYGCVSSPSSRHRLTGQFGAR